MDANDRIALMIGRLIIQSEHNADAHAAKDKIIAEAQKAQSQAKPGDLVGSAPQG